MSEPRADKADIRGEGKLLRETMLAGLDRYESGKFARKLEAVHSFDKAHLVMLVEQGLVDAQDGALMLKALREMEAEGVAVTRHAARGGLHSGEYYLTQRLGSRLGGQLHLGRSSADLAGVSRRILLRQLLSALVGELVTVRRVILRRAPEYLNTIMPAYTHGQHAQPTTVAHWLCMWASVFARDCERMLSCLQRINRSPAGAAAVTGSDFPLDRQRVADFLGFDGLLLNTMDATLSNDVFIECLSALAILAMNFARLGEDLLFWTSLEAGMMTIPDRFCDTSSIMAQKRNPSFLHELRAVSAEAQSALLLAAQIEVGPTGYSVHARKNAEAAAWTLIDALLLRAPQVGDLLASFSASEKRMLSLAQDNWSQAADVAGMLVRDCGLTWRQAHGVVAVLVRDCSLNKRLPQDVDMAMLRAALDEVGCGDVAPDAAALQAALDVATSVNARVLPGGPAPIRVAQDLAVVEQNIERDLTAVAAIETAVVKGRDLLEARIDEILAH